MENKEKKAIDLLRDLRGYVKDSSGLSVSEAVYTTAAQAMRNAADAMEAKDRLLAEVDEFLRTN